jgi:hypothetical protein
MKPKKIIIINHYNIYNPYFSCSVSLFYLNIFTKKLVYSFLIEKGMFEIKEYFIFPLSE